MGTRHKIVVLMDRAGWHSTGKLKIPKNLTIILLPPKSPELNPVENIWHYLRDNYLSNRVFENYDAIVEAAYDAWNKLISQPQTITSIGMRDWHMSVNDFWDWNHLRVTLAALVFARRRGGDQGSCSIPDDHIDPRRSALFMARSVLRDIQMGGTNACSTS